MRNQCVWNWFILTKFQWNHSPPPPFWLPSELHLAMWNPKRCCWRPCCTWNPPSQRERYETWHTNGGSINGGIVPNGCFIMEILWNPIKIYDVGVSPWLKKPPRQPETKSITQWAVNLPCSLNDGPRLLVIKDWDHKLDLSSSWLGYHHPRVTHDQS
jgi:hypothetical protein